MAGHPNWATFQGNLQIGQNQIDIGHKCTPHPAPHVAFLCPGPTHPNIT